MALPHLLLVDDSEAILAYEGAALRDRYALTTACDGEDALEKLRAFPRDAPPALVVLDLSMPRMDGEQLVAFLKSDAQLGDIPVLLVSSEAQRARALVDGVVVKGALAKPLEAAALRAAVERAIDDARRRRAEAGLAVVRVAVGEHEFALPLKDVERVLAQPSCRRIAGAPPYLRELFDLHGEPVVVLDLAARLGVAPRARYVDRSLVVVVTDGGRLALAVDAVRDPEAVAGDDVVARDRLAGSAHAPLDDLLAGVVRVGGALVPVLRPAAFVDPGQLARVAVHLGAAA